MNKILKLSNVACQKGDNLLFEQVNLDIYPHDLIHICGVNGVGKTSLLRIIAGLSLPVCGKIYYKEQEPKVDLEQFNADILYFGHQLGLKAELNLIENINFIINSGNFDSSNELLKDAIKTLDLWGYEDIELRYLSQGQQKKVALLKLWLTKANIWILDEPFSAIDVKGVDILRHKFNLHINNGGVIIMTSHQEVGIENCKQFVIKPSLDNI